MVEAPDQLVGIAGELDEVKAHQRRAREVEAARLIGQQQCRQLILLGRLGTIAPVELGPRRARLLPNDLERLIESIPDKERA